MTREEKFLEGIEELDLILSEMSAKERATLFDSLSPSLLAKVDEITIYLSRIADLAAEENE